MSTLVIAGVDVEATLGFVVTDLGGYLDGALPTFAETEIPSVPGAIESGPGRVSVREFVIKGFLDGANQAAVRANLDKLKALVGDGSLVSIVTGDRTGLSIQARCTAFPALNYPTNSRANSLNEIPCAVEMPFRAPSPYWTDVTPQSIGFTTSPVAMPQGTAPGEPVLTTTAGAITTPVITCKNDAGTTLWTATLASLTSGQRYRITTALGVMSIEKYNGSAWVSSDASLTAGVFPKPLSVTGAEYAASDWPTLEATTGTWTADYSKRWR